MRSFALILFFFFFDLPGIPSILVGNKSPLHLVKLPPGFKIELYAEDLPGARSMTLGGGGTVFVGTREQGRVYAVIDSDGDALADERIIVASGLNMPNGVAFRDNALYIAEVDKVIKFEDIERKLRNPPRPVVVSCAFPKEKPHGWKFIAFGPDGLLYVPVGMPCNACMPEDPRFGTIMRMRPDGSGLEIFAKGIRNTVGFDWNPRDNVLWFTDNGRDSMGEDFPPDELNRAPGAGFDFGFPAFNASVRDSEYGAGVRETGVTFPAAELGSHVAALGMRFYSGAMFPPEYRGRIFIAEHGSWDREIPVGYRIMLVRLEGDTPVSYEVFADGWLQGAEAWGRPVDLLVMPDGALLVSDDKAGCIYRIAYSARN